MGKMKKRNKKQDQKISSNLNIESKSDNQKNIMRPKLIVDPEVFQHIRKNTLLSGQFETGGLLLGEKKMIGNHYTIIIKKATKSGANAEYSTHHFNTDTEHDQKERRRELFLNGLKYIGEWHKHPGDFDQPSGKDLQTMKEITADGHTKDFISVITTTVPHANDEPYSNVSIKFYYYQRNMKNFEKITPEIVVMQPLRKKLAKIEKSYLDVNYIYELLKNMEQPVFIRGRLTDNHTASFLEATRKFDTVSAKIVFNKQDGHEFPINDFIEDLLIVVSINNKMVDAKAWQLDCAGDGMKEIDLEMVDSQKDIFLRLGGLGVRSGLYGKKVTMIGLGSVGSTAALQLTKAGIMDFVLIDPDVLKIHNVVRHVCDLTDLGRYKVDAVAEKLLNINPDVNITKIRDDCIEAYGSITELITGSSIIVVSTDTPDSRKFVNYVSVDLNIPSVHISLHERARTGSVYRIIPGITGCRNCVGDGRWGYEFIPGTVDYSEVENERDVFYQPGLDTDISLVSMFGVRMAISTILNPTAEVSPELKTNYIRWNGYPENGEAMLYLCKGIGIPKNEQCDVCGNKPNSGENKLIYLSPHPAGNVYTH